MALSYVTYTADGTSTPSYTIGFPYISTTHVKVEINGTASTDFSVNTGTDKVDMTVTPASGDIVKVFRQTPGREGSGSSTLLVDFQDGSVLSEADLDKVNQQLLYMAQEAEDQGTSNLPIDWDGNYNANSKRIKSLGAPTVDTDAVTKTYVDGFGLYGSGWAAQAQPQVWTIAGNNGGWSGTTGNVTITLDPAPLGDNVDLMVVTLDGFTQTPTTDYTLSGSVFTLKLGTVQIGANNTIVIRNFGVARDTLTQPVVADGTGDISLQVKAITSQTGDLQQWQNTSGSSLAKVAVDGDATFVDVNATGNAAVTGTTSMTGDVSVNTNKFTVAGATGNTTVAGTLGVTGATTLNGGISGNLNLLNGVIQSNGVNTLQILQIVKGTHHGGSPGENIHTNSNTYESGYAIEITPKSDSSKLLFYGSLPFIFGSGSTEHIFRFQFWLYKNSSTHNFLSSPTGGTDLYDDPAVWFHHSTSEASGQYGVGDVNFMTVLDNTSTDLADYSIVGASMGTNFTGISSTYGGQQGNWQKYGTLGDVWIIEIG